MSPLSLKSGLKSVKGSGSVDGSWMEQVAEQAGR